MRPLQDTSQEGEMQNLDARYPYDAIDRWALGIGHSALGIIEFDSPNGADARVDAAAHPEDPVAAGLPRPDWRLPRRADGPGPVVAAEQRVELDRQPGAAPGRVE